MRPTFSGRILPARTADWVFIGIVILVLGMVAYTYGGNNPPVLGHSYEELEWITTQVLNSCPYSLFLKNVGYCESTCPVGYYVVSGNCGSTHAGDVQWSLNGASLDHASWQCFSKSLIPGETIVSSAECLKVGDYSPISTPPACGNFKVEAGEECDAWNDYACPGKCGLPNSGDPCSCVSSSGVCGDGVANSLNDQGDFEVCDYPGGTLYNKSSLSPSEITSVNSLLIGNINTNPLSPPGISCSDFIDPIHTMWEYENTGTYVPYYFPDCPLPVNNVSCTDNCSGFDVSLCVPTCGGGTPEWDPDGDLYPIDNIGYPPGDYYGPYYPASEISGGSNGSGVGVTCGMGDPQRVNAMGWPIGLDGDGDGGNVDADAGEECDGGSPGQQSTHCSGLISCGEGETPGCGTNCKCECKSCDEIDWNGDDGTPATEGNGTPPPDSGC